MLRKPLRKPCRDCGSPYIPHGKYHKYCNKCMDHRLNKGIENLRKTMEEKRKEDGKNMPSV